MLTAISESRPLVGSSRKSTWVWVGWGMKSHCVWAGLGWVGWVGGWRTNGMP